MYVSGTVTLTNTRIFCGWDTVHDTGGRTRRSTCDFTAWTPATSMFMSRRRVDGSLTSAEAPGVYFQGAVYAAGNMALGQSRRRQRAR